MLIKNPNKPLEGSWQCKFRSCPSLHMECLDCDYKVNSAFFMMIANICEKQKVAKTA